MQELRTIFCRLQALEFEQKLVWETLPCLAWVYGTMQVSVSLYMYFMKSILNTPLYNIVFSEEWKNNGIPDISNIVCYSFMRRNPDTTNVPSKEVALQSRKKSTGFKAPSLPTLRKKISLQLLCFYFIAVRALLFQDYMLCMTLWKFCRASLPETQTLRVDTKHI